MNFKKSFFLSTISVSLKVVFTFILIKYIAIYVGVNEMVFYSQFINITTLIIAINTLGINNGLTKMIADVTLKKIDKLILIKSVIQIIFILSLIISLSLLVILFYYANNINNHHFLLLFTYILFIVSFSKIASPILIGFNNSLISIKIDIISTFISIISTFILLYKFGINGVYYSTLFNLIINTLIIFLFCRKEIWLRYTIKYFFDSYDFSFLKILIKFSVFNFVSTILTIIAPIFIRYILLRNYNTNLVSMWDGINKVSNGYLSILTAMFTIYFIPKISSISSLKIQKHYFKDFIKKMAFISFILALLIFIFKNNIINLIFSYKFSLMSTFFKWQLIGDIFKILTWTYTYFFLSRGNIKILLQTEIFGFIVYCLLSVIFAYNTNFNYFIISYMATYIIMFFINRLYFNLI